MHGVRLAYIITSMLELLHLKNVVLVKEMEIDFRSGFNVITGETGAGKSIVVTSLALLAGSMASESIIHPDEQIAFIEATFYLKHPPSAIRDYVDQDRLVVSRRIFRGRPTINKVNYESVSLKTLKEVMQHMMFLTAQHQVMELLDSSNHLSMYDQFIGNEMTRLNASYQQAYSAFIDIQKKCDDYNEKNDVMLVEKNDLAVMVADIDAQQFSLEEEDLLAQQQKQCQELKDRKELVAKILVLSQDAIKDVNELDQTLSNLNQSNQNQITFDALTLLEELNQLHQSMTTERLDIEYLESVDIEEINHRLHHIFQFKVKYNVKSLAELIRLKEDAQERLIELERSMTENNDLQQALLKNQKKVQTFADEMTALRQKHATTFEYVVTNQVKQLGMMHATFKLDFKLMDRFTFHGQDQVSFMFTANPNMPLKPLKNVVSGGELSRVMLALLVSNNGVLKQPLVVFDEIDVGIGGITANYIGTTLEKMATQLQLIVVTHLPQIARCAKHHFKISKTIKNNQSCVSIQSLNQKDVSIELQRMVGGDVVASMLK